MEIPNFSEHAALLVNAQKIFKGWQKINTVLAACVHQIISNVLARYISAKGL